MGYWRRVFGFINDDGILRLHNSLNDPEMEAIIFTDYKGVGGEGGTSEEHGIMKLKYLANGIQYMVIKRLWIHVLNFNEYNAIMVCVKHGFRIMVFYFFGCLNFVMDV